MLKEWPSHLHHPTRRALAGALAALVVIVALAGGLWFFLQRGHVATVPNQDNTSHVATLPNQGNSLLYLSTSTAAGLSGNYEDTLTMFRTTDGAKLWQYHISGILSTGSSPSDGAIRAGTAVEVVNGIVYFLVDTNPQSYPNGSLHKLIALRASDGTPLWQQGIQAGFAQLITVSDGIACLELAPKKNTYSDNSLMLEGYRTDTGALAWQRPWSTISSTSLISVSPVNATLYFLVPIQGATGQPPHTRIVAVALNTGQTRWSRDLQQANSPFSTYPLLSNHGLVVFLLGSGDGLDPASSRENLTAFDENSGAIRWTYQLPGFITNRFSHQEAPFPAALGVQQNNGVLYIPSVTETCCAITVTSLTVTALSISNGRQLWRSSLVQGGAMLLDTALANGTLYLAYDLTTGGGRNTVPTDTVITALQTSSGARRWENRIHQLAYTALAAAPDGSSALVHGNAVSLLQPQNGAPRWQQTIPTQASIIFLLSAGGKLVASFHEANAEGGAGLDHLCALQPADGHTLWCHTFDTQASWVELGP